MVDLTLLELHLDVDAGDFPFGQAEPSQPSRPTETRSRRPPASTDSGLTDRVPVRLLAGLAVLGLVIGAVVVAKLLRGEDDLAEAF